MKIYVSGPMRGKPAFNFPAFDDAAAQLEARGHEVFSPAKRDRDLHPEIDWYELSGDMADLHPGDFDLREALAADCAWICGEAEAICTLDGWENSSGANAEVALAKALGLPVYTLDQLKKAWNPRTTLPFTGGFITIKEPDLEGAISTDKEIRSVSESGAMKGVKLARFDLLPVKALTELAKHYGRTAHKYPPNNWRKGYEWSKSYAALLRHLTQWWDGEELDFDPAWPEGSPHLAAAAWHALTLLEYATTGTGVDDRP